jgi:murein DD-endopeptidase MepM/ murein hydrolase activator NlpD
MKYNYFAAAITKFKDFFDFKDKQLFQGTLTKVATPILVSSVFLIAVAFLVYNSVNAITIWSQEANGNLQQINPAIASADAVGGRSESSIMRSVQMKRPETSIYRNGKDIGGGIQFSVFPVHGGRVTGGYGVRNNPFDEFGFAEFHSGLDVAVPQGTPVVAAAKGVVTFANWDGGYGIVVMIKHADSKVATRYAHLSAINVSPGQAVSSGQQIGLVGSTGRSTGPHLHFELRIDDRAVDPRLAYPSE